MSNARWFNIWVWGLVLLLSGCQSLGFPAKDADKKTTEKPGSILQQAHRALALESNDMARQRSELVRDMKVISSGMTAGRDIHKVLTKEGQHMDNRLQQIQRDLEITRRAPPPPLPVPPVYNPLDDLKVSLEMDKEDVRHILKALAKMTRMNLLIEPRVLEEPPVITVSFRELPASQVFREILRLSDLYGHIDGNILRVQMFQEMTYPLEFLETNYSSNFSVGGDVLGSAGGGSAGSGKLTGAYRVTGQSGAITNPYGAIEPVIQNLLNSNDTKGQTYTLNRMTGTLHMKARPSVIRTATKLVDQFKEVIGRQVLIETRVMEISLSETYRAGVDWWAFKGSIASMVGQSGTYTGEIGSGNSLRGGTFNLADVTFPATSTAASGLGVVISGSSGAAIVDLLKQFGDVQVLSNPTIRARHGQPSMISVGTSNTYVSETEVTTTGTGTSATTETDVTVNTVFDGLMIGVTPFIKEDGKIIMTVHPIKSDVTASSLDLVTVGTANQVALPEVELKEMSTILETRSGDLVFLGGLIDKEKSATKTGVPVLGDIPVLGRLFSTDSSSDQTREMIIMMRVTVL
ncbi:pilus (MSHA type) biogenesis protein MshL [Magnetococcus sp. PR-3]|uniref:pilus (MSHA type) biogenesis protein MshL n=1 Tax=Magnetococcus sp. PR-3 TaxID=3120355 RepID=UPI002FCE028E